MKIAVTGGSGQLGTLVLRRLAADRAVQEIVSIDLKPPRVGTKKLSAITADVRDPNFARYLEGCDAVIHMAFVVIGPPGGTFDSVNIGGSKNVFESAAAAGVRKIVYSSSIAAYGVVRGHPVPIVETTPRVYQPSFAYSACKYKVEEFLDGFEPEHPGIAVVRIRPSILIGRYMEHPMGDGLRNRVMLDVGATPMPVVWDEDVADAIVLAVKNDVRGAFNTGTDDSKSPAELAAIGKLRLIKPPAVVMKTVATLSPFLARLGIGVASDPAWIDNMAIPMLMSSEKARTELGWKPRCRTASDVMRYYCEVVPGRTDRRLLVFFRLITFAARRQPLPADAQQLDARVHLVLTGPTGGDFNLTLQHGQLTAQAGAPRPPTVIVTMKATTFLDLLSGRTDYATAQLTGKIRIEGEALAGLIIQALVSGFREQAQQSGIAAWPARRLSAWISKQPATP